MAYNWADITSKAYLTLLELNLREFPIPAKKIKCKGLYFCQGVSESRIIKFAKIFHPKPNFLVFLLNYSAMRGIM